MLSVERCLYCVPMVDALPLFQCFMSAGQMLVMQYPHLHFTLLGNLICLPLVLQWYFSVLVLLGLSACFSWQVSLGWSRIFRATMKLRNDVVYRPLVHSINIHHLSTESIDNLLLEQSALDEYWHAHRWLAFCETCIDRVHYSIELVCVTRDESGCRNLQYSKRIQLIFQLDTTWSSEIFALQDAW